MSKTTEPAPSSREVEPLRLEGQQALDRMKGVLRRVRAERNDAQVELRAALEELEATKAELATARRRLISAHTSPTPVRRPQRRVTTAQNQENQP